MTAITHSVRTGMLFVFALPAVIQSFMHVPASTVLQDVYNKDFGVGVGALAVALVIAKLFDAVSDPLIGVLSDRYFAKYHTRKPFLLVGTLVLAPSIYFLYTPPAEPSVYWFLGWFIATYLGWTIIEVPYRAWSYQLSNNYERRSFIQMMLVFGGLFGAILFFLIPAISKAQGWAEDTEVTGQTLALAALVIVVVMPLLNLLIVAVVPNGDIHEVSDQPPSLKQQLISMGRNQPFLYLIGLYLIVGIGAGMNQALSAFYIGRYLEIPDKYAAVMALALPFSLIGAPVGMWLCNRFQKHIAWVISLSIMTLSYVLLYFIEPGEEAFKPLVLCIGMALFGYAANLVALTSLVGDIVDYGIWKFEEDSGGAYSSVYTFASKIVTALGNSAGLGLIWFFGFDDQVAGELTERTAFGLQLAYLIVPAITMAVALPFILKYPITRAKHAEILAGIAERDRQAA